MAVNLMCARIFGISFGIFVFVVCIHVPFLGVNGIGIYKLVCPKRKMRGTQTVMFDVVIS